MYLQPSILYMLSINTQVAIRALGFDVKKQDVQKIMRDYDKDETGKITLPDFTEVSTSICIHA